MGDAERAVELLITDNKEKHSNLLKVSGIRKIIREEKLMRIHSQQLRK